MLFNDETLQLTGHVLTKVQDMTIVPSSFNRETTIVFGVIVLDKPISNVSVTQDLSLELLGIIPLLILN